MLGDPAVIRLNYLQSAMGDLADYGGEATG